MAPLGHGEHRLPQAEVWLEYVKSPHRNELAIAGLEVDPWEGVRLRPDDSHSRRELTKEYQAKRAGIKEALQGVPRATIALSLTDH